MAEIINHNHDGVNSVRLAGGNIEKAPQSAMTAATAGTAGGTYTSTEQGLINNHTTRINELETKLRNLGFLL